VASAGAERAEVEVQVQAQGAAGDSNGDEADDGSGGDTMSSPSCGTGHTAQEMLAAMRSQLASQAKIGQNGLPVLPVLPAERAQRTNRPHRPRRRRGRLKSKARSISAVRIRQRICTRYKGPPRGHIERIGSMPNLPDILRMVQGCRGSAGEAERLETRPARVSGMRKRWKDSPGTKCPTRSPRAHRTRWKPCG
jgi:hypothetical protein